MGNENPYMHMYNATCKIISLFLLVFVITIIGLEGLKRKYIYIYKFKNLQIIKSSYKYIYLYKRKYKLN